MLAHTEGPPSEHVTLADLDAAALVLVVPAEAERSSLWLGLPLPPANVAHALRAVAREVAPDQTYDPYFVLRSLCDEWDGLSKGETHTTRMIRAAMGDAGVVPAYPRGMGDDHRSAVSGRYVDDAEAEAHPDTTVTEHRDQPAANLGLATTQELIDELAARAEVAAAAGESWPHYTTMKGH